MSKTFSEMGPWAWRACTPCSKNIIQHKWGRHQWEFGLVQSDCVQDQVGLKWPRLHHTYRRYSHGIYNANGRKSAVSYLWRETNKSLFRIMSGSIFIKNPEVETPIKLSLAWDLIYSIHKAVLFNSQQREAFNSLLWAKWQTSISLPCLASTTCGGCYFQCLPSSFSRWRLHRNYLTCHPIDTKEVSTY